MRSTAALSRSLGKSLATSSNAHICRSCLAQGLPLQRRQIQSSAPQRAGFLEKLTGRVLGPRAEDKEQTAVSSSSGDVKVTMENRELAETSADDPGYVEAVSWEGLPSVGSLAWAESYSDKGYKYQGWATIKKDAVLDEQEAGEILYKAANFVIYPVSEKAARKEKMVREEAARKAAMERRAAKAAVEAVQETSPETANEIARAAKEAVKKAAKELKVAKETAKEMAQRIPSDSSWLDVRVTDPKHKFMIAKNLQQEAGIRLSDFVLNSCGTLRDFRRQMIVKPKAKKLAPVVSEVVAGLPNVRVHDSRVTMVDKEKAVGRWKVIEQALIDQGLPITVQEPKETMARY